jgi:hypothetical protein
LQIRMSKIKTLLLINIAYFIYVAYRTPIEYNFSYGRGWAYFSGPAPAIYFIHFLVAAVSLYLAVSGTKEIKKLYRVAAYHKYNMLLILIWSAACFSILPCVLLCLSWIARFFSAF